jgi:hypothetical protein
LHVAPEAEPVAVGAALLAGVRAGLVDEDEAVLALAPRPANYRTEYEGALAVFVNAAEGVEA